MFRRLYRITVTLATGCLLICWPLLLPDATGRWLATRMSPIGFFAVWGASALSGALLLFNAALVLLRRQGRAAIAGRPEHGLAGKAWGVLAPGIWVPPVLVSAVIALSIGWETGIGGVLVLPALVICLAFGAVYFRTVWLVWRRRRALHQRNDTNLEAATGTTGLQSEPEFQTAVQLIASLIGVPPMKLRGSDRFGSEIGTFASLDETLDRLGGLLLLEQRKSHRQLSLEHIETINDYAAEWVRCRRAPSNT